MVLSLSIRTSKRAVDYYLELTVGPVQEVQTNTLTQFMI